MTISESIHSKLKKAKIIGFIFWLLFAATIVIPVEGNLFFISLIPFIGFGGTVLYILLFLKCPRCDTAIGQATANSGGFFSKKSNLNFCPNCGVDFKDEL